jgi:hypothetical protein
MPASDSGQIPQRSDTTRCAIGVLVYGTGRKKRDHQEDNMSDHPKDGLPNDSSPFKEETTRTRGVQRRDLLLGGSSLAAMTALTAASPAAAQDQPPPRPPGSIPPASTAAPASTGSKLGEILPFPQPPRPVITEPDWRKVPQPKPVSIRPPRAHPIFSLSSRTRRPLRTRRHLVDRSISPRWTVSRKKA